MNRVVYDKGCAAGSCGVLLQAGVKAAIWVLAGMPDHRDSAQALRLEPVFLGLGRKAATAFWWNSSRSST